LVRPWGNNREKFNLSPGSVLWVGLSNLNQGGRLFALATFEDWTNVTGIHFEELTDNFETAKITMKHGNIFNEAFEHQHFDASGKLSYSHITISEDRIASDWHYGWHTQAQNEAVIDYDSYSLSVFIH
jgi:hypothetical protein